MAARRAQGLVLQRHDHRGQAVVAFGLDDVAYLRSEAGRRALAEVAHYRLTDSTLVADIASARARFGDRAAVLVETTVLRRKAAAKLSHAEDWLYTDEALQQATAEPVAVHRARRLTGARVHDATCSIGAELAALRKCADVVVGSDIDPVRLAMARHNVPDVDLCRADALRPVTRDAVVVLDPARRSGGRRRFDPRDYTPPLDVLLDVYRSRYIAVKSAPGIDFEAVSRLGFAGEIEVTSLGGSVREACLWSSGLTD
ncbi:MAG TPA: class I SAM-dependent methyltransferase, partial [Mycobacterium sp.]|nr:class I SAM-dependent methyltransferase [Mycobacterium sp.]